MSWRAPTVNEIAYAYAYIRREFVEKYDGAGCQIIDGEMWAEALAFGRTSGQLLQEDMHAAREAQRQLTAHQWQMLAARADYLAAEQSDYRDPYKPRFKV